MESRLHLSGTLSLFTLLLLGSCSPEPVPDQRNMLDITKTCELISAPDLTGTELEPELLEKINRPLNESDRIQIPFVNKVKCDNETRTALLAATDTVYEIPLKDNGDRRFLFSFAIDDDHRKFLREAVEFEVQLFDEESQSTKTVFQEVLSMSRRQNFGWQNRSLEIREKVPCRIRLITRKFPEVYKTKPVLAYWSGLNLLPLNERRSKNKRPNLILISLDSLRADHLSLHGFQRDTAPALDRLIRDSIVFDTCWSQWHSTQVSHNSIFSGQYEENHRVPRLYPVTPSRMVTLTELLAREGYRTAAFTGSGRMAASLGLAKGFERYFDNETRQLGTLELGDNRPQIESWLQEFSDGRFFLFIHTYQIHSPYPTLIDHYDGLFRKIMPDDIPRMKLEALPIVDSFDRLGFLSLGKPVTRKDESLFQCMKDYYDGSIRFTSDFLIDPLLDTLKRLGIYDNTIIVVLSDHGEEFFDHERFYHNDALFEELIHVPLIIKPTGPAPMPQRIETPVQTVDLLPTLCELMRVPDSEAAVRDGRSLAQSIWTGKEPPPVAVFSQSQSKYAARKGERKLILRCRVAPSEQAVIPRIECLDLKTDPGEVKPQVDDLTGYEDLYESLQQKLISRHDGIHIRFPAGFQGKKLDIRIETPDGSPSIRRLYEIGVTRLDSSIYSKSYQFIQCRWTGSSWPKELVLEPRPDQCLSLRITISVDGRSVSWRTGPGITRMGDLATMNDPSQPIVLSRLKQEITVYGIWPPAGPRTVAPLSGSDAQKKLKTLGYID